jgi:hypothetical protein
LSSTACRTERAETREVVVWRLVGTWSGRGPLQTEAFIGDTGMLRLRWEARKETAAGAGTLRVTVHSAVSGRPLVVAVDHRGTGADFAYVNEDPREFYVVVESANLEWSLTAEEGFPATAEGPRNR